MNTRMKIAVFVRSDEVLAIIEIKNWTHDEASLAKTKPTKQLKKYLSFDVPVYVLWANSGISDLINKLKKSASYFDEF